MQPVLLVITAEKVHWNEERSKDQLCVSDGFIFASKAEIPHHVFFTRFGFVKNKQHGSHHPWEIRFYRGSNRYFESVGAAVADTIEQALRSVELKNAALLMSQESYKDFKRACDLLTGVSVLHHHCNEDLYES